MNKMTYGDLVRKYFPDATNEECDFLLWETTAFPLCSTEEVERQLKETQLMLFANKKNNLR